MDQRIGTATETQGIGPDSHVADSDAGGRDLTYHIYEQAEENPAWIVQERLRDTAQKAAQRAIKRGELERPDRCERCNREAFAYAHHEDYSKPLDVNWLCARCHGLVHKRGPWLARQHSPSAVTRASTVASLVAAAGVYRVQS